MGCVAAKAREDHGESIKVSYLSQSVWGVNSLQHPQLVRAYPAWNYHFQGQQTLLEGIHSTGPLNCWKIIFNLPSVLYREVCCLFYATAPKSTENIVPCEPSLGITTWTLSILSYGLFMSLIPPPLFSAQVPVCPGSFQSMGSRIEHSTVGSGASVCPAYPFLK